MANDFLAGRMTRDFPPCSYARGLVLASMAELVPALIVDALRQGFSISSLLKVEATH